MKINWQSVITPPKRATLLGIGTIRIAPGLQVPLSSVINGLEKAGLLSKEKSNRPGLIGSFIAGAIKRQGINNLSVNEAIVREKMKEYFDHRLAPVLEEGSATASITVECRQSARFNNLTFKITLNIVFADSITREARLVVSQVSDFSERDFCPVRQDIGGMLIYQEKAFQPMALWRDQQGLIVYPMEGPEENYSQIQLVPTRDKLARRKRLAAGAGHQTRPPRSSQAKEKWSNAGRAEMLDRYGIKVKGGTRTFVVSPPSRFSLMSKGLNSKRPTQPADVRRGGIAGKRESP